MIESNDRIIAESLSFAFRSNGTSQFVFRDISFSVGKGVSLAIMGSSGIGKTTLCRVIAGILQPASGRVLLDGQLHCRPDNNISVVFQNYPSFPWLNVEENVAFGLKCLDLYNPANVEHTVWLLEQVGLEDSRKKYPRELSGGMQQRLAIARSLAVYPKVLILDEPFSSLDPFTRAQLRDLIVKLQQQEQFALILVTHDLPDAFAITDKSIVLAGSPATSQRIERKSKQSLEDFTISVFDAMNSTKS